MPKSSYFVRNDIATKLHYARHGGKTSYASFFQGQAVVRPGEPLYAQVNREKKKSGRQMEDPGQQVAYQNYAEHADHWQVAANHHGGAPLDGSGNGQPGGQHGQQAGDSWV